jgi:subtilisin family serine protease
MGVGGLYEDGSSQGNEEYEEVSAYSGGGTTYASCSGSNFCVPNGSILLDDTQGGTSSATAITAGIAGLVRAYNPTLTAPQVRERLRATAAGPHDRVDAYAAVLGIYPLSVDISGPTYVDVAGTYTWEAMPQNGTGSYTYAWEQSPDLLSWYAVGSNKTYSDYINPDGSTFYLRVTVTSGTETATDTHQVNTANSSCGEQIIC